MIVKNIICKRRFWIARLCAYFAVFGGILLGASVFAASYNWATGGHGGGNTTAGQTHYDCYSETYCPRWILVPQSVYESIRANSARQVGNYTSLPECADDKNIMIAGNQNYAAGTYHDYVQLYNLISVNRPNPTKESRIYASVASSDKSVEKHNFFSEENSDGVKGDDGHVLTYAEILSKVIELSGTTEKNLAVVCPSMADEANTRYSESNVSVGDGATFAATDVRDSQYTTNPYAEANIFNNEAVLTFSHNAYTKNETENVSWSISKEGLENSDDYDIEEITGDGLGKGSSPVDFKTEINTLAGRLYTANDENRPGKSGDKNYISRSRYKITFKKDGEYTFCESIGFDGEDYLTKACAKLTVGGDAEFFSESIVSANGGDKSTDIQGVPTVTVYGDDIHINLFGTASETKEITFSHNIYAKVESEDVPWNLKKSDSLSGGNGYTIEELSYAGLGTSSVNPVDLQVPEKGYFTASKGARPGVDNYGNRYLARNTYKISFSEMGNYEFCESIAVNDGEPITRACIKVSVQKQSMNVSGNCNLWVPDSYKQSGAYKGTTSVVSKVINNGDKGNGHRAQMTGSYSGWRGVIDEGTSPKSSLSASFDNLKITYAKPGDEVEWLNCYYPGVQTVASTYRTYAHGAHGDSDTVNTNYYESNSVFGNWENKYTITSDKSSSNTAFRPPNGKMDLGIGNWLVDSMGNKFIVSRTLDVGKYFEETITSGVPVHVDLTNEGIHTWSCQCDDCCCPEDGPCTCCCTCSHPNDYIRLTYNGSRIEGPVQSGAARVEVPYNYINNFTFSVNVKDDDPVYAGETVSVESAMVNVNKKQNDYVDDYYTTVVDEAEVRLLAFVARKDDLVTSERLVRSSSAASDDVCSFIGERKQCETVNRSQTMRLNKNGLLDGYSDQMDTSEHPGNIQNNFRDKYNVFDASAGDYFCMAMAVYPATSGAFNNLDPHGDYNWRIMKPECRVIAKRPSMQVLGGSVFSNGNMTANVNEKNNFWSNYAYITNYIPFHNNSGNQRVRFGTWVEEAIVANGKVQQIASGAALGYNGESAVGIGEENSTLNFCQRWVPLTFANYSSQIGYPCDTPSSEYSGVVGVSLPTENRSALVDYWGVGVMGSEYSIGNLGDLNVGQEIRSLTEKDVREVNVIGGVTISGGSIAANQTRIVKTTGDVNISGNIEYISGELSLAGEVPQVVIYAGGDINISCDVKQIDAILIAGGTVRTCANNPNGVGSQAVGSKTAGEYSLTIRGMVIANKVEATREYGNGVGDHSGDPAETINYDTSALVWGRYMAGSGESNTLTLTYQHELAPRL
ncbi:hypothetical protein IKE83_01665 [Candidatus Saccharibacteria bacterium]|nr:hypothetical protein [Candidatus Saccharibacteria bacterium]